MTSPDPGDALQAIAARRDVAAPAAVVVAHPDDEVLGLSAVLPHLKDLRLIHASDGAKGAVDGAGPEARFRELDAALSVLNVTPAARICYALPDGALVDHLGDLVERLVEDLAQVELVLTHAFEGGHPDHDACAVAVQAAVARLHRDGQRAPERLEFALYRREPTGVALNSFPVDAEIAPLALTGEEQVRRVQALAAFESQQHVVSRFPADREAVRLAPEFDAAQPRAPGALLFAGADPHAEGRWRTAAARFLATEA